MEKLICIRGAITVKENSLLEIKNATKQLISELFNQNKIDKSQITNIIFTVTDDLDLLNPATVAREEFELDNVPMLCVQEMKLKKGLQLCIRILMQVYSSDLQVKHVYLGEAANLRPDLSFEI
jgi:chorismate mutase